MKYKSTLAALIDEAMNNCIQYGEGRASNGEVSACAVWAENEKDIEVFVYELLGPSTAALRLCYTEHIPEEYR